jgi:hypothetical protein
MNCATPFLKPLGDCTEKDVGRACSVPCEPVAVGFMKIDCRRAINMMCGKAVHDPDQCMTCLLANKEVFKAATEVCVWPWIERHICHSVSKPASFTANHNFHTPEHSGPFDINGGWYWKEQMFGFKDVVLGNVALSLQLASVRGRIIAQGRTKGGQIMCGLPICKLDKDGLIPRTIRRQQAAVVESERKFCELARKEILQVGWKTQVWESTHGWKSKT